MTDVELAERAAAWWCRRRGGSDDPGEWVGVAWEGIAARAASRARRGLPPMDERQRYLAARSALIDFARGGQGGFGGRRGGRGGRERLPALLVPLSVADPGGIIDPEDRRAAVVAPEVPQFGWRSGRPRWSAAEKQAMRAAAAGGARLADVCRGLGRSFWGVEKMASRLRVGFVRGRPADHEARAELLRHLSAGLSVSRAAAAVGASKAATMSRVRLMVRDGLLVRTGGASSACRYVPPGGLT